MAFGKGTWDTQNKKLPGTYINFVGEKQAPDAFGVRGKAAMAISLDWGEGDGKLIKITAADFMKNARELFGYDYLDAKVQPIYEVFLGGATELYLYRLNGTGGTKATCEIADAVYAGTRGNDISIVVENSIDGEATFNVTTMLAGLVVDRQIAVTAATLKDNAFVKFKASPKLAAKTITFTTGANGTAGAKAAHLDFLEKISKYMINAVGLIEPTASDGDVTKLYSNWAITQREVAANPVQAVLYNSASNSAAVINVDDSKELVAWFLGAEAGCPLNETVQNKVYNGSYAPTKSYNQYELEKSIADGKIVLQQTGDVYRVLVDINSLIDVPANATEEFKQNQTIRAMDQIGVEIASIFNNGYIGKVANNQMGRLSFKNQVGIMLDKYADKSAIEPVRSDDIICVEGQQKGSLILTVPIQIVGMLEKAYVTVMVG